MVSLKQVVLATSSIALSTAVDIHVRPGGGNVTGKVRSTERSVHDFNAKLTALSSARSTHMAFSTKILTILETVEYTPN